MKNYLLIICFLAFAHTTFSQKLGLNLGRISSRYTLDSAESINSTQLGLVLDLSYTNHLHFQVGLDYLQKGTAFNVNLKEWVNNKLQTTHLDYTNRTNWIDMPLMLKATTGNEGNVGVSFLLGGGIGWALNGTHKGKLVTNEQGVRQEFNINERFTVDANKRAHGFFAMGADFRFRHLVLTGMFRVGKTPMGGLELSKLPLIWVRTFSLSVGYTRYLSEIFTGKKRLVPPKKYIRD